MTHSLAHTGPYLLAPWEHQTVDPQRRERRNAAISTSVSLLIHALALLALLFIWRQQSLNQGGSSAPAPPIAVHLRPPQRKVERPVEPKIEPKLETPAKKTRTSVIALARRTSPRPVRSVEPPLPPLPQPPVQTTADPNAPPTDMMAMVNAARARRNAAEANAAQENAAARGEGGPSENDIAMANINRNLGRGNGGSTGGIFEILNKGTRTAQFSFRGWKSDARNNWREVIDVDAGLGGDIEHAIIRRMIALIRTHYSGDFTWDSHRLGREVQMSARPEDNTQLEEFLMKEFFETDALPRRR